MKSIETIIGSQEDVRPDIITDEHDDLVYREEDWI